MDGGTPRKFYDVDIAPDEEDVMTRFGMYFMRMYNFDEKYQGKLIGIHLVGESDIIFKTPDGLTFPASKLLYPHSKDWLTVVEKLKRMKEDGDVCYILLEGENQESDDSSDTSSDDHEENQKVIEAQVHCEQESSTTIKSDETQEVLEQGNDYENEVDEDILQMEIDEDIEDAENDLTQQNEENNDEKNDVDDVQNDISPTDEKPLYGEQEQKIDYEKKTQQLNKLINDVKGLHGKYKDMIEKQKEKTETDQRCDNLRCDNNEPRNSTMRVNNMAEANKNQVQVEPPRAAMKIVKRDPKDRCYECHDYGHYSYDCPYKGQGVKKCYECNEMTTHIANDCPQRIARGGGRHNNNNNNNNNTYRSKTYINKRRY